MAETKSKPSELTERGRFWHKHLKAWNKTSLSQAEYCRRHDLSLPAFGWWKQRLARIFAHKSARSKRSSTTTTLKSEPFIKVNAAETDSLFTASSCVYEIALPNNRCIRFGADFDLGVLTRLIQTLEQLC